MSVLTKLLGLAKATVADDPRRYLANDLAKTLDRLDQLAYGSRQLLVNGGFEIWQRGNGPFATGGSYTADRWQIGIGGTSSMSVSKDTTHHDTGSAACIALAYTQNAESSLVQKLEDYQQFQGQAIALSARVNTATANAVRLFIYDGTTYRYGAYHPGSGTYATITLAVAIPTTASQVLIGFALDASCTAYLDNAMLVIGSVAAPYAPLTTTEEWARVQRYYEVHGGVAGSTINFRGNAVAISDFVIASLTFMTRKAVVPTLTKNGTWAVANCGQPTAADGSLSGYRIFAQNTSGATNIVDFRTDSTDDTISAEANF